MIMWYVVDEDGTVVRDDWMINQNGKLYTVTDGWGCEGGANRR